MQMELKKMTQRMTYAGILAILMGLMKKLMEGKTGKKMR